MKTIYKVFNESFRKLMIETTDFQNALDCWSEGMSQPWHEHWVLFVESDNLKRYIQGKAQIQAYAEELMEEMMEYKPKNRIEARMMKDEFLNRVYGDSQKTGTHDKDRFLAKTIKIPLPLRPRTSPESKITAADLDPQESYDQFMRRMLKEETNYDVPEVTPEQENDELSKAIDFHGKFEDMDDTTQDAIINPKHYKLFTPEDYAQYPEGIEYMDLCEKALAHLVGVEAHLAGQTLKYNLRLGKKDSKLQDARKMAWYSNRLVKTLEKEG